MSLHYNGTKSYLFVNGEEIQKFKEKDSETVATSLCLGNISKDSLLDYTKNAGLTGYIYWLWCYFSWWYIRHSQVFNKKY